jgi:hypothetical protein
MAKIEKASEEICEFITNIIESHNLDNFAQFRFFELPKQKEAVKVAKASATAEYFAKADDMVTVFVNPKIWERLDDKQRELLTENALNGVYFDEKEDGTGKLAVEQPNLAISAECYAKFGKDLVDAAEIASHALRQLKEEEKAKKLAAKEKKFDPNANRTI